ncbi:4-hydroxy-2-oxoheptanedioate aldolase [Anaerolineae bacterium]|nr:4-hydroxy-2-oxoheptanedioate aldolase [Anaerolineae bacterium]
MLNRVKECYSQEKLAIGSYITFPAPAVIEVAAQSGLDFVRLDTYHYGFFNPETLENMIRTAYSYNVTPWVRLRNDPWLIGMTLEMGAQAITIPNCSSAAEARAAVSAVFYPPKGKREMSRGFRFQAMTLAEYREWASTQVILSCMIEGMEGLENYREIIAVDGVDVIQVGLSDLSQAVGVPGAKNDPKVLEAEKRVIMTALEAGKQVSIVHPNTPQGIERTQRWVEQGVRIVVLEKESRILGREYSVATKSLRNLSDSAVK